MRGALRAPITSVDTLPLPGGIKGGDESRDIVALASPPNLPLKGEVPGWWV